MTFDYCGADMLQIISNNGDVRRQRKTFEIIFYYHINEYYNIERRNDVLLYII